MTFSRPELATELTQKLLRPGALDLALRSGIFLSAPRRTGKSTFLIRDLVPALSNAGAIVIYVDLWSNPSEDPAQLIHAAIVRTLAELQSPGSKILEQLKRVKGLDLGAAGFKFGFKLDDVGAPKGVTLGQALQEVVDQSKSDVVLIVDEVQHAITTDAGSSAMTALKAARDQINLRVNTQGHFLFVGTGSHRARINEMSARRNQAFTGATTMDFPVLGDDFVRYQLDEVRDDMGSNMPSEGAAIKAFRMVGNRPEELLRALNILRSRRSKERDVDLDLETIAATLRETAADLELHKLSNAGPLAEAIFDRLVQFNEQAQLFSAAAAEEYSAKIGRPVRVEEIQPVVNQMLSENILMRRGHGSYGVSDEFVGQVWRERFLPAADVLQLDHHAEPLALPGPSVG